MAYAIEGGSIAKVLCFGLDSSGQPVVLVPDAQGRLQVVLSGGGALIGTVGISQATPGTTNRVSDGWAPSLQSDVTDNDSDKAFTVPASTEWQPVAIHVLLTSTATVGNRLLAILFTDGSNNAIVRVRAATTQAASLARYYSAGIGQPMGYSFLDTDLLTLPLPSLVLPAGYKVRVYDNKAIDAAADDMHVRMLVQARAV